MEELGTNISECEELEELIRSCPRCGSASANKSNPSGRCRSCLKKLSSNKKKVGHYLHNHKVADDAMRRQTGRNGTSPKKKSGHGTRKEIISKVKSEEKKAGQVVSLDRKDNSKGYTSSNVRGVDPKLNRGRHKVDTKKLAAWRKKLKKNDINLELLYTALLSKASRDGNDELLTLLQSVTPEEAMKLMSYAGSEVNAFESELQKAIKDEVGKSHTIEVHPHVDHILKIKGAIQETGKPSMHVSNVKKLGVSPKILDTLPRDEKGQISTEALDDHIAKLPKSKINVKVVPYESHQQQQKHRDNPEHIITMHLHPEEKAKLNPRQLKAWEHMKLSQHSWNRQDNAAHDQIGWTRVDDNKNQIAQPSKSESDPDSKKAVPHDHWHLDEIQSDFQNTNKIKDRLPYSVDEDVDDMHKFLSHGHDDPQHLAHSVTNALGRRLGIQSTSMDMPQDQAKKSALQIRSNRQPRQAAEVTIPDHRTVNGWQQAVTNHMNENDIPEEHLDAIHELRTRPLMEKHMDEDDDFLSAVDKIGGSNLKTLSDHTAKHSSHSMYDGRHHSDEKALSEEDFPKDLVDRHHSLSPDEKDSLSRFLLKNRAEHENHVGETAGFGSRPTDDSEFEEREAARRREQPYIIDSGRPEEPEEAPRKLPVHQIDTYNKRPKKLGFKEVDKESILGPDEDDKNKTIQYSKLHKSLDKLKDLLEE